MGFVSVEPEFDSTSEQEQVLKMALGKTDGIVTCTVVVSMGYDQRIHLHRAEDCR
jgi:hypothetical protein